MKTCVPPTHFYLIFAYIGIRRLTCQCGRTASTFNIVKNTGQLIDIALNVEALDTRHSEDRASPKPPVQGTN